MEKIKKYLFWQMLIMDYIFIWLFIIYIFAKIMNSDLIPTRLTLKHDLTYLIINLIIISIFTVFSFILVIFYQWMDKRINEAIMQKTNGKYKQKANKKIIILAGVILAVLIVTFIMEMFFPSINKFILLTIEIVCMVLFMILIPLSNYIRYRDTKKILFDQ